MLIDVDKSCDLGPLSRLVQLVKLEIESVTDRQTDRLSIHTQPLPKLQVKLVKIGTGEHAICIYFSDEQGWLVMMSIFTVFSSQLCTLLHA